MKIPLRYVFLVGCFHYNRRILDAWISKYIATAREEFEKKDTVRDRRVHVPVPVVTDGQVVASLTAEHLQPTFGKDRVCIRHLGRRGGRQDEFGVPGRKVGHVGRSLHTPL